MFIKKHMQKASTSTHGDNGGTVTIPKATQNAVNHDSVDQLIDPEDDEAGDTHTEVTASTDEQNVGTIDNDEDPAAGYIDVKTEASDADEFEGEDDDGEEDEGEGDDDMEADDEEVDANLDDGEGEDGDEELDNQQAPQILEMPKDGSEEPDWDGDLNTTETADFVDDEEPADMLADGEGDTEDMDDEDDEIVATASAEDMSILDVDGTDDNGDNLAFATVKNTVHVMKANRIIASMTKKIALSANRADVYLSDRFPEVVEAEIATAGLRKGLRAMGFVLARVNVASSQVVTARIDKGVRVKAAAIRKVQETNSKAFEQSLTIAAVGINRAFFKDTPNELRAALETELQHAGVRGGSRLVQKAFAQFGPAYAKQIVELANKISAMPQETRNSFVAALDLTSEDMEDNPFGSPDGSMHENASDTTDEGEGDASFDDEFIDDIENPQVSASVHAAFTPGTRLHASAGQRKSMDPRSTGYSVSVASVLNGSSALPFAR